MRVKAISNFRQKDEKRGVMLTRRVEETFDMDPFKEGEAIYGLLRDLHILVTDEKFIPKKSQYEILHFLTFETDGQTRTLRAKEKVTLDQETACQLMVSGHVKPEDSDAWTPRKLLGLNLSDQEPKKMFDDWTPPSEPWEIRRKDR